MSSDERVLLNVGGSKFEVLRKTFGRFPQSLLGQLSSSDVESTLIPGPNGEYFFDRNGRFFEFIVEYYRSGTITPPTDLSRQQVVAELQYWGLDPQPYLSALEDEPKIRNYVEAPVEVPLENLDQDELLERLAELPLAERLRTCIEFVRHSDTDLIHTGVADLTSLDLQFKQNSQLINSAAHLEVSYFIALGYYRLGQLRLAREYVDAILRIDSEYTQAKDLQILLIDTSVNYSRLGLLALGVALIGAAAFKFWASTPKKK